MGRDSDLAGPGQASRRTASGRVAGRIRRILAEGRLAPHERLPSLRKLSEEHGVAVNTMRKALSVLEKEGVLYCREGNGSFVHPGWLRAGTSAGALQCVTVLTADIPHTARVRARDARDLIGYTEALEQLDVKLRFALWPISGRRDHAMMLSDRYAYSAQGCVLSDVFNRDLMEWLSERGAPFVVQTGAAYSRAGLPPHCGVFLNKVGAVAAAARRLIGLGHRRIAYVGVHEHAGVRMPAYEGYLAAMACAGLEAGPEMSLDAHTVDPGALVDQLAPYLRAAAPTAVIAGCDAVGMDALAAADRLGLAVPERLSVISYGDTLAEEATPPLSSIVPGRQALARTAVETLLDLSAGRTEAAESRVLECRYVERATVGPPPSGGDRGRMSREEEEGP